MHACRSAYLLPPAWCYVARASTPEQTSERREAKVYQTGSNIAKRDRGGVLDVKTVDPELLHQQMNRPTLPKPAPGAGR